MTSSILLPPPSLDDMLVLCRDPQHQVHQYMYLFNNNMENRYCKSQVFWPRTQRNISRPGLEPGSLDVEPISTLIMMPTHLPTPQKKKLAGESLAILVSFTKLCRCCCIHFFTYPPPLHAVVCTSTDRGSEVCTLQRGRGGFCHTDRPSSVNNMFIIIKYWETRKI